MSGRLPSTSLRITANTLAGAHSRAKRPPLTAESRLRMVLISTISAPLASSSFVISCSSSPEISGLSNSALPPPESRKITLSSARRFFTSSIARAVARNEFSSGTGWPAS